MKDIFELDKNTPENDRWFAVYDLNKEAYVRLHNELNFAAEYWSKIKQRANLHMIYMPPAEHDEHTNDIFAAARKNSQAILESPLYNASRDRLLIKDELPEANTVTDAWSGWIGLNGEDIDEINGALTTLLVSEMRVTRDPETIVKAEQVAMAFDALYQHNLTGMFIPDTSVTGMDQVFAEHFADRAPAVTA